MKARADKTYIAGTVKVEAREFNIEFTSKNIEKPYSMYIVDVGDDDVLSDEISYPDLEMEVPTLIVGLLIANGDLGINIRIYNDDGSHWYLEKCTYVDSRTEDNGRANVLFSLQHISFIGGGQNLVDMLNDTV